MRPFLAMIMPVGEGAPVDPGYSPPWARPRPPGSGGGQPVYPDQGLPGYQPYPDQGLPGNQPYPDQGLPGNQPYPDQGLPKPPLGMWGPNDPRPTPPIYIPPEGSPPPLGIWGPTDPRPTHPIVLPPGVTPEPPVPTHPIVLPPDLPPVIPPEGGQPERPIDWKTAWTPATGWIVIGIPAEGTLVPTPSKKA